MGRNEHLGFSSTAGREAGYRTQRGAQRQILLLLSMSLAAIGFGSAADAPCDQALPAQTLPPLSLTKDGQSDILWGIGIGLSLASTLFCVVVYRFRLRIAALEVELSSATRCANGSTASISNTSDSAKVESLFQSPLEAAIQCAVLIKKHLQEHWLCQFTDDIKLLEQMIDQLSRSESLLTTHPELLRKAIQAGELDDTLTEDHKKWLFNELLNEPHRGLRPSPRHQDSRDWSFGTVMSDRTAPDTQSESAQRGVATQGATTDGSCYDPISIQETMRRRSTSKRGCLRVDVGRDGESCGTVLETTIPRVAATPEELRIALHKVQKDHCTGEEGSGSGGGGSGGDVYSPGISNAFGPVSARSESVSPVRIDLACAASDTASDTSTNSERCRISSRRRHRTSASQPAVRDEITHPLAEVAERVLRADGEPISKKNWYVFLDLGLAKLKDWDFDIFVYASSCGKGDAPCRPLTAIGFSLLHEFQLMQKLDIDAQTVFNALDAIEAGYRPENPFHSALHGADVAQSLCHFLRQTGLVHQMTAHEILAVIIAALCHDFDHPGVNNQFLIATHHPLSMVYNDIAVLENHHASAALTALRHPRNDMFRSFPLKQQQAMRSLIVSLILATDLKAHFQIVNDFKRRNIVVEWPSLEKASNSRATLPVYALRTVPSETKGPQPLVHLRRRSMVTDGGSTEGRVVPSVINRLDPDSLLITLKMALKCADLGHPAKLWKLHYRWSQLNKEENYRQGDREKRMSLEVSPFMDRHRDRENYADNQVGFFNLVILPMWDTFVGQFRKLEDCRNNLNCNLDKWLAMKNGAASPRSDDLRTFTPKAQETACLSGSGSASTKPPYDCLSSEQVTSTADKTVSQHAFVFAQTSTVTGRAEDCTAEQTISHKEPAATNATTGVSVTSSLSDRDAVGAHRRRTTTY